MTITRFAPSPTGHLHLGHALAAWVAREEADRHGGMMLLRHEDLDRERCREEYYDRIEEDLRWLGIHWMGQAWRQSERQDTYRKALQRLIELEVLYPCFCTRREIALELSAMGQAPQQDNGVNPSVYPGTCRNLSEKSRREKFRAGEAHAWRLDSSRATALTGALTFFDHRAGTIAVDSQLLGDVILARKDTGASYHLAVVVDDAAQQVSLVTRGEDLLGSTHVHRLLQNLLCLPVPEYLHHVLVCDENGKRLAKRHHALALRQMSNAGLSAADVIGVIRRLHEKGGSE
jgi:glutamyl-Q tRNA(Asp) synthetase